MPLPFGDPAFFNEHVRRHSEESSNSYVHVLLHSTNATSSDDHQTIKCVEPFQLSDRMWICRLPDDLKDIVYEACGAPGVPHQKVFRQNGQLYTIALFAGPWSAGQLADWDAQGEITKFIACSQLIHPTSIGFGNAARLTFDSTGGFLRADPGPCRGAAEYAFTIPPHRNWISKSDCEQIKNLLPTYKIDELPNRVARAHWNVQHAGYQYFFEVKALLVVSGLEALVHTRGPKAGRTGQQFRTRTKKLAQLVGVPYTSDDASEVWDHRSDVVHGRDPWASRRNEGETLKQPVEVTSDNPTVRRYLRAEQLLRSTVLKCLTDEEFALMFASDDSVERSFHSDI